MQTGLEIKYFVLKPRSKFVDDSYAWASRQAILAYAEAIGETNGLLASDLRDWARQEELLHTAMKAAAQQSSAENGEG